MGAAFFVSYAPFGALEMRRIAGLIAGRGPVTPRPPPRVGAEGGGRRTRGHEAARTRVDTTGPDTVGP